MNSETGQTHLKRGRKPREASSSLAFSNANANIVSAHTTPKARASKKNSSAKQPAATVFASQEDDMRAQSDDENIVLNLKIYEHQHLHTSGCGRSSMNNYNPDMCDGIDGMMAFQSMDSESYLSKPFELNGFMNDNHHIGDCMNGMNVMTCEHTLMHTQPHVFIEAKPVVPALKVIELLKDFEEKNKHNEWPTNTSIHCYWCCHKFNNTPFGIPVKYVNERFHVYGCFCSLECCAAYNVDSKDAADDIWERASLINMLARRLGYKNYVKPAPSKLALKIFGGHMEIDEFRDYCKSNRIINLNFPPMLTLTQQIEEINEADINNDFRYIPIDTERINKYKEKMKLRRAKPITNFKNTLDHTMNLKYGCAGNGSEVGVST